MFSTEIFISNSSPNITGKGAWPYMGMTQVSNRCKFVGAMYDTTEELNDNNSINGQASTIHPCLIGVDASRSNQKFGESDTFQPDAGYSLMIIKE